MAQAGVAQAGGADRLYENSVFGLLNKIIKYKAMVKMYMVEKNYYYCVSIYSMVTYHSLLHPDGDHHVMIRS